MINSLTIGIARSAAPSSGLGALESDTPPPWCFADRLPTVCR
jgi:hypothetical protein